MPGGFGVFPGVFIVVVVVAVVALPLLLLLPKTPGKKPKPPGKLACVENLTRAISGGPLEVSAGTICHYFSLSVYLHLPISLLNFLGFYSKILRISAQE